MAGASIQGGIELSITAATEEVRRASDWLERSGRSLAVPDEDVGRLLTCLNEALANVLSHGGPGALEAPIQLSFRVIHLADGQAAELTMSDAGTAFNPLEHASRPRPQSLAEAEVGGLGVMMMRQFSDELDYRRAEGRNHLIFRVRWAD